MSQSIPLASLEIRDAVFQQLIKISPASITWKNLSPAQAAWYHEDPNSLGPEPTVFDRGENIFAPAREAR
jgi:hypothetical protein